VELGPDPEQVVRLPEATRAGEDGAAEHGVLPVEVDFDELVEVPVAANVNQLGVIGPEVRVGQAGGEDPGIEVEPAIAGGQFPGAEAEAALAQIKGAQRLDVGAVADRLAGEKVAGLHEPAVERNMKGPRCGPVG